MTTINPPDKLPKRAAAAVGEKDFWSPNGRMEEREGGGRFVFSLRKGVV